MKYNIQTIISIVRSNPKWKDLYRVGCATILKNLNDGSKVIHSTLNDEEKDIINILTNDQIIEIDDDRVKFSPLFENFMKIKQS